MVTKADEPNHIGILWSPEPDWHFRWRMLKASTNFILSDCLARNSFNGERLDELAGHFGYSRMPVVDDRFGGRRQFFA